MKPQTSNQIIKAGCCLLLILASALMTGCHESGTWEDDAKNWKRIFGVPKPPDATVIHSWFWRSPHFTYEYEYYIQVEKDEGFQKRLLTMNAMKEVSQEGELQKTMASLPNKPAWFAPKPITQYRIWVYSNTPNSAFRLLVDRETGDLFLSDCQL